VATASVMLASAAAVSNAEPGEHAHAVLEFQQRLSLAFTVADVRGDRSVAGAETIAWMWAARQ
jgi:hypothetical protein